jgi:hypothetical protein
MMDQDNLVDNITDLLLARMRRGRGILVRLHAEDPPVFRRCGSSESDPVESQLIEDIPGAWRHITTLKAVLSKVMSAAWNEENAAAERLKDKCSQLVLSFNAFVAACLARQLANDVNTNTDIVEPVSIVPSEVRKIAAAVTTSNIISRDITSLQAHAVSSLLKDPRSNAPAATWALLADEPMRANDADATLTWFADDGTVLNTDSVSRVVRRNLAQAHRLHARWRLDIAERIEKLEHETSLPFHVVGQLAEFAPRLNEAVTRALSTKDVVGVRLFGYRNLQGRPTEVMVFIRPEQSQVHLCARQGVSDFAIGSRTGEFFYFCPSQVQARLVICATNADTLLKLRRPEVCVPKGSPKFCHRYTGNLGSDDFAAASFVGERGSTAIPSISDRARSDSPEWWKALWRTTMPFAGYRNFCIHRGKKIADECERILRREFYKMGNCPSFPLAVRRVLRQGEQMLKHAHEHNAERPMADWDKMLHPIDLKQGREWLGNRVHPYSP